MAMVYDLPTERTTAQPMQAFEAPQSRNFTAEQGAEQGQAITKAGAFLTRVATDLQNEIDTAATKERDNNIANAARTTLYDPEKGYLLTNGKNALEARKSTVKAIDDAIEKEMSGCHNDVQKAMLKKVAMQRRQQAMGIIDGHAIQQAKVYNIDSTDARINNARSDAASNYVGWEKPDSIFNTQKGLMLAEVQDMARLRGFDADQTKEYALAQTTKLHEQVLNGMLSNPGFTEMADQYYKAHINEIAPTERAKIYNRIENANADALGVSVAGAHWDEIMGGSENYNDPVKSHELFNALRDDPKLKNNKAAYQAAREDMQNRISSWNNQQSETNQASENSVWQMFNSGKSVSQIKSTPEYQQMGGESQGRFIQTIENIQAAKASRAAANASRSLAEMERQDKLLRRKNGGLWLTITDPQVLRSMSRAEVEAQKGVFGLDATEALLNKWDTLQTKDGRIKAQLDEDDFNKVARTFKLNPKSKNENEQAKVGELKFRVEQAILAAQKRGGELTRDEKIGVIKKEISNTVLVSGFWGNTEVPAIALTPTQRGKVIIPKEERGKIAEALAVMYRKTGKSDYAPTETNMRRLYLLKRSPAAAVDFNGGLD